MLTGDRNFGTMTASPDGTPAVPHSPQNAVDGGTTDADQRRDLVAKGRLGSAMQRVHQNGCCGARAVVMTRGGDDCGAGAGGGMLGEDAVGKERLVVWVGKDSEQGRNGGRLRHGGLWAGHGSRHGGAGRAR